MEATSNLAQALELIRKDLEWDEAAEFEKMSEAEVFDLLANRIAWLIEHRMEWLLSLMYRMDVNEAKVSAALHPLAPEPANVGLARLVLERQKQRAFTKQHVNSPPLAEEDLADLAW
jgi:hypothetical protein